MNFDQSFKEQLNITRRVPLHYQKKYWANISNGIFNSSVLTGVYKQKVRTLLKTNKALALALQSDRAKKEELLAESKANADLILFSKVNLISMSRNLKAMVAVVDETLSLLQMHSTTCLPKFMPKNTTCREEFKEIIKKVSTNTNSIEEEDDEYCELNNANQMCAQNTSDANEVLYEHSEAVISSSEFREGVMNASSKQSEDDVSIFTPDSDAGVKSLVNNKQSLKAAVKLYKGKKKRKSKKFKKERFPKESNQRQRIKEANKSQSNFQSDLHTIIEQNTDTTLNIYGDPEQETIQDCGNLMANHSKKEVTSLEKQYLNHNIMDLVPAKQINDITNMITPNYVVSRENNKDHIHSPINATNLTSGKSTSVQNYFSPKKKCLEQENGKENCQIKRKFQNILKSKKQTSVKKPSIEFGSQTQKPKLVQQTKLYPTDPLSSSNENVQTIRQNALNENHSIPMEVTTKADTNCITIDCEKPVNENITTNEQQNETNKIFNKMKQQNENIVKSLAKNTFLVTAEVHACSKPKAPESIPEQLNVEPVVVLNDIFKSNKTLCKSISYPADKAQNRISLESQLLQHCSSLKFISNGLSRQQEMEISNAACNLQYRGKRNNTTMEPNLAVEGEYKEDLLREERNFRKRSKVSYAEPNLHKKLRR